MAKVYRRENESIDDTLRRFKREVRKVGVLRDARKHERYEKPSEIRKKKRSNSRRRRG
ncbi:30S ribosomal protein S21 [Acetomicrobium mobile]|uniref:30S ribosomal protein S21 n=1 Tax=Acetomicrobium mobile TaxID=97477 RepID=UPI0026F1CCA4|nr:30S ribosomal protein S21 [Acetomicrobium mobile]